MKETKLTLPELGMIAGTRGMLGAGAALLFGEKLNPDTRKAVGWTLFLIGAVSTIPLVMKVASEVRKIESNVPQPKPGDRQATPDEMASTWVSRV
jgi:hypothetical protein